MSFKRGSLDRESNEDAGTPVGRDDKGLTCGSGGGNGWEVVCLGPIRHGW